MIPERALGSREGNMRYLLRIPSFLSAVLSCCRGMLRGSLRPPALTHCSIAASNPARSHLLRLTIVRMRQRFSTSAAAVVAAPASRLSASSEPLNSPCLSCATRRWTIQTGTQAGMQLERFLSLRGAGYTRRHAYASLHLPTPSLFLPPPPLQSSPARCSLLPATASLPPHSPPAASKESDDEVLALERWERVLGGGGSRASRHGTCPMILDSSSSLLRSLIAKNSSSVWGCSSRKMTSKGPSPGSERLLAGAQMASPSEPHITTSTPQRSRHCAGSIRTASTESITRARTLPAPTPAPPSLSTIP